MFREELLAVQERRHFWAYTLAPLLFCLVVIAQFQGFSGATLEGNPGQIEALSVTVLAELAIVIGLSCLVFAAIHTAIRLRNDRVPLGRFFVLFGAVLTRLIGLVFPPLLALWGYLIIFFMTRGVAPPEWSSLLPAVVRMLVFITALVLVGCAAGATFSQPVVAVLVPLVLFGVGTALITWLATAVTPWAVLLGPVDNFLVWCSGYRIRLIPMWQAGLYWFVIFGTLVAAFLFGNSRRAD